MRRIPRRIRVLAMAAAAVVALILALAHSPAYSTAAPPAAAPAPAAAAGLSAAFTVTSSWGSGYAAKYTITNDTGAAIPGWSISFDLPEGQQLGSYWDARETASGRYFGFVNQSYDGFVPADGGTVSFGFVVTGPFSPPTSCTVDRNPCGGGDAAAAASPSPAAAAPSAAPAPSATRPSGGGGGGFAVAPYADMTNSEEGMLDTAAQSGLKAFTAAFVTGSGCTPVWGDTLPVTGDPTVTGELTRAASAGAMSIVSFGGEAGIELASSCTDLSQLVAAYQSVIDTLQVTHLDFDIEGAAIADTASNNLRFQALKALEAANPGLVVSLTIPVLPTGPDDNGQAFLRLASADGVRIGVVNVMAMDYGAGFDGGADMGRQAVQAAQGTLSFLRTVFPGATFAMIGVTPMIGQNDDAAEVFSEADASTLVSFAQQNHLGRLAFWSVDRDQSCAGTGSGLSQCSQISQHALDFTAIFDGFTG
jgi:Cellulose binding domain